MTVSALALVTDWRTGPGSASVMNIRGLLTSRSAVAQSDLPSVHAIALLMQVSVVMELL